MLELEAQLDLYEKVKINKYLYRLMRKLKKNINELNQSNQI